MIKSYRFSILFALIVFVSCVIPRNSIPESSWDMTDKLVHFVSFALLYITIFTEHQVSNRSSNKGSRWLIASALFLVAFGGLIELVQGLDFVQRSSELLDFKADTIGVGIGMVICRFLKIEKIYPWFLR